LLRTALREYKERNGYTYNNIAEKLGSFYTTTYNFMNNKGSPSLAESVKKLLNESKVYKREELVDQESFSDNTPSSPIGKVHQATM
jgi:transcriptional regulator with XRE-family HTH domain